MTRAKASECPRASHRIVTLALAALVSGCGDRPDPTGAGPYLQASPREIALETVHGAKGRREGIVRVKNGGDVGLRAPIASVRYSGDATNWLWPSIVSYAGEPEPEYSLKLALVGASDLPPGSYEASVTVDSRGAVNTPATVSVSLAVVPSGMTWTEGPPSPRTYDEHTATVLADGGVLVIDYKDIDRLEPTQDSWTHLRTTEEVRSSHQATLLADGRVLLTGWVGGLEDRTWTIIDSGTGETSASGSFLHPLHSGAAVRLEDGRVLVAGSPAEILDPIAETTVEAPSIPIFAPTFALLDDGRVLVLWSEAVSQVHSVPLSAVFDPATGTVTERVEMPAGHGNGAVVRLANGHVLAFGGYRFDWLSNNWGAMALTQEYDPATGTWSKRGPLHVPRGAIGRAAALLPSGKVLVAGGCTGSGSSWSQDCNPTSTVEIYDPATRQWTLAGTLATVRHRHTVSVLPDGTVAVIGGGLDPVDGSSPAPELWREPEGR